MSFGSVLRRLRRDRDLGIKQLAPELGVNYTYLSKLENDKSIPSEDLIDRIAEYFHEDRDRLYIAADKIPTTVLDALKRNPDQVLKYLRSLEKDDTAAD